MANIKLYKLSITMPYKGGFATSSELISKHPSGKIGDYAYVIATNSYWYWNNAETINFWVNQNITESAYVALSTQEKSAVPYIVGV